MSPTREAADALYQQMIKRARKGDANDRLYQLEASMDYDPDRHLSRIMAPVLAINFVDDELNPAELCIPERAMGQMSNGRLVLVPATERSRGHHTALQAAPWKRYLSDAMKLTAS